MSTWEPFKQTVKKIATLLFTGGLSTYFGLLTFSGAFFGGGILFAVIGMIIESVIFNHNIGNALETVGQHRKLIEHHIARRELKKYRNKNIAFVDDYFNQRKYLHELEEGKDFFTEKDLIVALEEIERVKKRLEYMEDTFIENVLRKKQNNSNRFPATLQPFFHHALDKPIFSIEAFEKEVSKKQLYMRTTLGVSVFVGLSTGFVALSSLNGVLAGFGLSIATTAIASTTLIGLAAIGYGLVMYNAVNDIILNDSVKKWTTDFKTLLNTPASERTGWFYPKVLGVVALLALVVFATIATAGTWWYLAKAGATLIKAIPIKLGSLLSSIAWAATILPTFTFNLDNAIKSIKDIAHDLKDSEVAQAIEKTWDTEVTKAKGALNKTVGFLKFVNPFRILMAAFDYTKTGKDIKEALKTEIINPNGTLRKIAGIFRFINPFRIVRKILNATLFASHLVGDGLASDRVPWIKQSLTATGGTLMSTVADYHYIMGDHGQPAEEKTEPHRQNTQHSSHHDHPHNEEEHEEDHHEHEGLLLKKLNQGLNYASAIWDVLFSWSWQASKTKFFPTCKLPTVKMLSTDMIQFETLQHLEHRKKYYPENSSRNTTYKDLITVLNQQKSNIERASNILRNAILENTELTTHQDRFRKRCCSSGSTRSYQFINNMLKDRSSYHHTPQRSRPSLTTAG